MDENLISFDVGDGNFSKFINKLRRRLCASLPVRHGLPIFDGTFRGWLVVELIAYGARVNVKINSRDFYLHGFENSEGNWWRLDEPDIDNFGASTVLPYSGSYLDLRTRANAGQLYEINLTRWSMIHDIHVLRNFVGNFQDPEVPLAMLRMVLTICEATRFYTIQRSIHNFFRNNANNAIETRLSHLETAALTKWGTITKAYFSEKNVLIPHELAIVSHSDIRNILAIGLVRSGQQDVGDGAGGDGPDDGSDNGSQHEQYDGDGAGGDGPDDGSDNGSQYEQDVGDGAGGDGPDAATDSGSQGGRDNMYEKDSASREMKGCGDVECRITTSHVWKGVYIVALLQLERQWIRISQSQYLQVWESERHVAELSGQIETPITPRCLAERCLRTTGGRCFRTEEGAICVLHSEPCQWIKRRLLEVFSIQFLDFTKVKFEEIFGIIQLQAPTVPFMLSIRNTDWAQIIDQNDGRKVHVIDRDLTEPDRIVGELLQPGGYLKLVELGLQDCVEEIDAQRVLGYALFKDGKTTNLPYPLKKFHSDIAGRSFHHGRFIQRMRGKVSSLPNVRLEQGTVTTLLEKNGTVVFYKTNTNGEELLKKAYALLTIVCDGCFSNLRHALCSPKVDVSSCFVGLVLENCKLPFPNHGHMVLADPSPILFYTISSTEVHCLVDVPGQKVPSIANVEMANYLKIVVAPQFPPELYGSFIGGIEKGNIRTHLNSSMPAAPHPKPGEILMGDVFNMYHPLIGGGMTVAFSDIVVLRNLLKLLCNLHYASSLCKYLESFYTLRKPVASTINTLSLGGDFSAGPISLLSGLNPHPFRTFQGIHGYCIRRLDSKDNLIINKDSKAQLQEAQTYHKDSKDGSMD